MLFYKTAGRLSVSKDERTQVAENSNISPVFGTFAAHLLNSSCWELGDFCTDVLDVSSPMLYNMPKPYALPGWQGLSMGYS